MSRLILLVLLIVAPLAIAGPAIKASTGTPIGLIKTSLL